MSVLRLWRGRWRWAGVAAIAAGIAVVPLARAPDILIDGEGKLFAVRDGDGHLALSSVRRAKFQGGIWLRRAAQHRAEPWPIDGMGCVKLGCVHQADAHLVALVDDPRALREDCAVADVVVSRVPVRWLCPGPATVIDRFDLWRDGAHALWLDEDGVKVQSVFQSRGVRPWVVLRGTRRRLLNNGGEDRPDDPGS